MNECAFKLTFQVSYVKKVKSWRMILFTILQVLYYTQYTVHWEKNVIKKKIETLNIYERGGLKVFITEMSTMYDFLSTPSTNIH